MKNPLYRYIVLILLGFAGSCQNEPRASLKLTLFHANWCPPCKTLEKELSAANILDDWKFEDQGCVYHVAVKRVDLTDFEKTKDHPDRKFKKTEAMPEQALFMDNILVANDNYSDKASLDSFVKNKVRPIREKQPRLICELQPGFLASVKRLLGIASF